MKTLNRFFTQIIGVSLFFAVVLTSCSKKEDLQDIEASQNKEVNAAVANVSFTNTANISFNVRALDRQNKSIPLDNIKIYIGDIKPENLILHGGIDDNGIFNAVKTIPTAAISLIGKVIIDPNFIGLAAREVEINKSTLSLDYTFRFDESATSNGRSEGVESTCGYTTVNSTKYAGESYSVPNSDSNGRPASCDLFSVRNINTGFMTDVNSILQYNKDNVDNTALANASKEFPALSMSENGEVWITFLGEVAGYKNALGYYVYDESEHDALTVNKIKQRAIAFPNTSLPNSGGNLPNGFTYKIPGVIKKGQRIGFFIIANGNSGSSVSDNNKPVYYTDSRFNPESNTNLKQHALMLADRATDGKPQGILLSFEDLPRDQNMGTLNKDFNDVIFYITANPAECIVPEKMVDVKTELKKCDECNKPVIYQDVTCGVLMFEDLWPVKGDFDMNDLVIQYKFLKFKNRNNRIINLQAEFDTKALGAMYKNGFGFEMTGFNASAIQKVTGSNLSGVVTVDGKGLETGQTHPTVIVYDNAFKMVKGVAPFGLINTQVQDKSPKPRVQFNIATINIEFSTPPTDRELGAVPCNPFIIANGVRDREVHLAGYKPTSKAKAIWDASATYFNGADVTAAEPFRTTDGKMPFALNLPIAIGANFKYPIEMTSIEEAYPDFRNWANDNTNPAYMLWYNNFVSTKVFE